MTRMLSKPKRSLETASIDELLSAIAEFHEVEDRFGELTESLAYDDLLAASTKRLARVPRVIGDEWQMKILPEDFDDFDLGRLVRLPRTSVEECDFDGVDFIFETRQGQRLARDLS
ncbi:hypothetical protein [Rhizobium sp. 22-785-1]